MNLIPFFIICPLNFLAGLVDSIGGGGGLISLPAFMLAGLSPHAAVATNKLASTTGTTVSTVRYCKNGCYEKNWRCRAFSWPLAALFWEPVWYSTQTTLF